MLGDSDKVQYLKEQGGIRSPVSWVTWALERHSKGYQVLLMEEKILIYRLLS